ncbi:MAG: hypothetical protein WAO08_38685 [Hyphomicrobiaceae bacterium]
MRVFTLWLLAMVAGIGLMMWLLPPREIKRRLLLEAEQPTPKLFTDRVPQVKPMPQAKPKSWPVICPVAPPCWRDGKPIVGAL